MTNITKQEFFDRLDSFPRKNRGNDPKGIRLEPTQNFGLDRQLYVIWIVGAFSVDETLCIASDIDFVQRYASKDKADKDLIKYRKWFSEYERNFL